MYLISARKLFLLPAFASDADEIREVDLDELAGGAPPVGEDALAASVRGRRILAFVHGYNTNLAQLYLSYTQLLRGFGEEPAHDVLIGYVWPGGRTFGEYPGARERADLLARRLAARLDLLTKLGASLDVVAHSLGNRLVLGAMLSTRRRLRCLVSLAAAVPADALAPDGAFAAATRACERLFVLHSRHDRVLAQGFPMFEDEGALGLAGPAGATAGNVFVVDCEARVRGLRAHGAYTRQPELYDLMRRAAAAAPHEPRLRLEALADGW